MKLLLSLFLCGLAAFAQPATTPISDTIYDQFGRPYTGTLRISLSTPGATQNAAAVVSLITRLTITNGVLNTALVPNDTMTPSGSYYVFAFGAGDQRNCTIPTSVSAIRLGPYCTEAAPAAPLAQILLSQINASSYANGYYCVQVVNGIATLTTTGCPGSGGGGLALSSLTNTQLASLTNTQLSTLSN